MERQDLAWTIFEANGKCCRTKPMDVVKKAGLKRETESLIIAAQEQAIRTNLIKAKIDKSQHESKCRMCGEADESINHMLN